MKRRSFIKTSVISGAAVTLAPAVSSAMNTNDPSDGLEFYELRTYTLTGNTQQKLVEDYFKNAAIPALNRLGVKHVGVFTEMTPVGQTKIFVLVPYNSIEHFTAVSANIGKDQDFLTKGVSYLNAPASMPAYERIDSSLLKAFVHMPKLEAPVQKSRIFELRQYQSASEVAGKMKIEMFNDEGEIDIFKRLGFNPVFWGETIIGSLRPNLTYMVTFDNMDAKAAHWKAFGADPQWKKISAVPEYADSLLVSKITSTMLQPTEYSQI